MKLALSRHCSKAHAGHRETRTTYLRIHLSGAVQNGQRGPWARDTAEEPFCEHAAVAVQLEEQYGETLFLSSFAHFSRALRPRHNMSTGTQCGVVN